MSQPCYASCVVPSNLETAHYDVISLMALQFRENTRERGHRSSNEISVEILSPLAIN